MSDQMLCPGCASLLHAARDGQPCPYCGLSAAAIEAVRADMTAALKRADKAEAEVGKLRGVLRDVRCAVDRVEDLL